MSYLIEPEFKTYSNPSHGPDNLSLRYSNSNPSRTDEPFGQSASHTILIDRRTVVRDCFRHMLRTFAPQLNVLCIGSVAELQEVEANLILIGIEHEQGEEAHMRAQMSEIRRLKPNVPIVVITDNDEPHCMRDALRYGASGIVPTSTGIRMALAAIELALAGGIFAPNNVLHELILDHDHDAYEPQPPNTPGLNNGLTPQNNISHTTLQPQAPAGKGPQQAIANNYAFTQREREILEQLKKGIQNKLIAYHLGISENTVKTHLRNIMKKLHATNRTRVAFLIQNEHFSSL